MTKQEANARLIALAPELLEGIRMAEEQLHNPADDTQRIVRDHLRKLLARLLPS